MTPSFKKNLFLLALLLFSGTTSPLSAEQFRTPNSVPPARLPPLSTDPSKVVERLKQYVTTGERLARQFESTLEDYRKLADRYVSVQKKCVNDEIFNTPLFRDADRLSVCNNDNQKELKRRLQRQAMKLDRYEYDLVTIKRKVSQATKRVSEMLQMQELKNTLDQMDASIESVEDIERMLKTIENQQ